MIAALSSCWGVTSGRPAYSVIVVGWSSAGVVDVAGITALRCRAARAARSLREHTRADLLEDALAHLVFEREHQDELPTDAVA
jgi:hypothetical protein